MAWELKEEDLKRYPHFDKHLSIKEINRIVASPTAVARNAFYPFIRYTKSYQPFRDRDERPEPKKRLIRYASRRDAYIFSYYRHLISEKYECELSRLGLENSVIAYRKIPVSGLSGPGKCNINFAHDAFTFISNLSKCSVVVLDISKYFESLDHAIIEKLWCELFNFVGMPSDHAAVFKNITKYRVVDREKLYERLGIIGEKLKKGKKVKGYLVPFDKMRTQLCSPNEFRKKVAGNNSEYESIIEKHNLDYGIPQGAPISDIIANLYLISFDIIIKNYAQSLGGLYMRYSDDILIIVPGGNQEGKKAREFVRSNIQLCGEKLLIKDSKCSLSSFHRSSAGNLVFSFVEGEKGKNGLEYLGFRFDGTNVYLQDQTLSGFYRKVTSSLRHEVRGIVARYPGKDISFLLLQFNTEEFMKKYGRVEDFDNSKSCEDWTFWTYARKSAEIFGSKGLNILYQLKRYKLIVSNRVLREFREQLSLSVNASGE